MKRKFYVSVRTYFIGDPLTALGNTLDTPGFNTIWDAPGDGAYIVDQDVDYHVNKHARWGERYLEWQCKGAREAYIIVANTPQDKQEKGFEDRVRFHLIEYAVLYLQCSDKLHRVMNNFIKMDIFITDQQEQLVYLKNRDYDEDVDGKQDVQLRLLSKNNPAGTIS